MEQNERLYEGPRTRRTGSTRRVIEHAAEQLLHCGQTVVMDPSFLRDESWATVDEISEFVEKIGDRLFYLIGHNTGYRIDWETVHALQHKCTAVHIWVIETNKN